MFDKSSPENHVGLFIIQFFNRHRALQILFHLVLVSVSCVFQGTGPCLQRCQIFGIKLFIIFPFTFFNVRTVVILLSVPLTVK